MLISVQTHTPRNYLSFLPEHANGEVEGGDKEEGEEEERKGKDEES